MSRDKILSAIKLHQPAHAPLPSLELPSPASGDVVELFKTILVRIGGSVVEVKSLQEIHDYLKKNFPEGRWLSVVKGVGDQSEIEERHSLENVVLTVLQGELGVAENGAVWITNASMGDRALPFITQHLAVVIDRRSMVANLHQAYDRIGTASYEYGTFIAGPSKTADIEQSLVLGAHGPKSHTVFLLKD